MRNLILTGFSGTGKSRVAREVGRRLGWPVLDTDEEIVRRAGRPIARIFAEEGEDRFREIERRVLAEACTRSHHVIATGGGALVDPASRDLALRRGVVVCLEALPETIYERLRPRSPNTRRHVRPLLQGDNPLERIRTLKAERQPIYAQAHWVTPTDYLSADEVVEEVLRGWRLMDSCLEGKHGTRYAPGDEEGPGPSIWVSTSAGLCPISVGWGTLDELGTRMKEAGLRGTAFVVTDEAVAGHYARGVESSLGAAGFTPYLFAIPPGEGSKSLDTARRLYAWLAERRAERRDVVVALGGGVVGDLAGYVAATFARGMPFVQAPTSLTAMVDSSIGGKTAVNVPEGKNLVGAFHQSRLIVMDVSTLQTLPSRALTEGWAEAIKHGLILDRELFEFFEMEAERILALDPSVTTRVIRWSAAIKADVVSRDERETKGLRTLLNYGHTIGHALEAATGYDRLLHGEAVAVGMRGAALIGLQMGATREEGVAERQQAVLERFGLPARCPEVDVDAVHEAMARDKKVADKRINWVLLERVGAAGVWGNVPPDLPLHVLRELRC